MSTRFESRKSKEWFERQIAVKKSTTKVEESEKAVEQMVEAQRVIENNAEHGTDSEVTIIGNTPV